MGRVKFMQKLTMVSMVVLTTFNMSVSMAEEPTGISIPPPAIDTASPETALRSYWAYLDWKDRIVSQYIQSSVNRSDAGIRTRLLGGERLALENWRDREQSPKSFQREIIKTVQSGDDSAEIFAHIRNVTPIDPPVDPNRLSRVNKLLFSHRTEGVTFKYLLGKKDGAWKIMQVFSEGAVYGDKTGWIPVYTLPFAPVNSFSLDP